MYMVKICIYTDGDYSYKDFEFHIKDDNPHWFYFEERKDAVKSIINFMHSLRNSFSSSKSFVDHVRDYFFYLDDKIELITSKIPTFYIEKDLGNQSFMLGLLEVDKVSLQNKSYTYEWKDPIFDFSDYDLMEDINWESMERELNNII